MKEYWPYIALAITFTTGVLLAIFRNQLAKIGDNLTSKESDLRRRLISGSISVIIFLIPIAVVIFSYTMPFSRVSTTFFATGAAMIVANAISLGLKTREKSTREYIKRIEKELELEKQRNIDRATFADHLMREMLNVEKVKNNNQMLPTEILKIYSDLYSFSNRYSHTDM